MDITEIREKGIRLRHALYDKNITCSLILLFGSYARGTPREHSDIDFAVISGDFGGNYFDESVLLNLTAARIDTRIQAVPVGLDQYFNDNVSPLLYEIRKEGIPLF